jgi:hypothetical protein
MEATRREGRCMNWKMGNVLYYDRFRCMSMAFLGVESQYEL